MEIKNDMTAKSQGQKISSQVRPDKRSSPMQLAETDPIGLLNSKVDGTEFTYGEIYHTAKQFGDFETASREMKLGPKFLRDISAAASTAHFWLNKKPGFFKGCSQVKRTAPAIKGTWTRKAIIEAYRANKYSLVATHNQTAIPIPQLRKEIRLAFTAESKPVVRGKDWKDGQKEKKRFNLVEFIKSVHKHYSMRVFCESTGYSPRWILDFCHELNEGGYKVIPPTIKGADMEWLALYYPEKGDMSFYQASQQKLPPKRSGKEIFKTLQHSENPNRRQCNLPAKGGKGKKRRATPAKRGLVASRGGKVKRAQSLYKGLSHEERSGIERFLSS